MIFIGSILYRKRSQAKGFELPIAIGVLGIVSLAGYIAHVMRPLQGSNDLVWVESFFAKPKLGLDCFLEITTGVIFTLMQVVSYILHMRAWRKEVTNQKIMKIGTVACVLASVVCMAFVICPYTQKSLYNELAQRVYEEERLTADVTNISVGANKELYEGLIE